MFTIISVAVMPSVFIFFSFVVADYSDRTRRTGFWWLFFLGITLSPVLSWLASRLFVPGSTTQFIRTLFLVCAAGCLAGAGFLLYAVYLLPDDWIFILWLPAAGLTGTALYSLRKVLGRNVYKQ